MTPWCRGRPTIELTVNEIQQCEECGLREDSSGSIISGETGLAHTGTIVNDLDVSSIDDKKRSNSLARQPRPPCLVSSITRRGEDSSHFDYLF